MVPKWRLLLESRRPGQLSLLRAAMVVDEEQCGKRGWGGRYLCITADAERASESTTDLLHVG